MRPRPAEVIHPTYGHQELEKGRKREALRTKPGTVMLEDSAHHCVKNRAVLTPFLLHGEVWRVVGFPPVSTSQTPGVPFPSQH